MPAKNHDLHGSVPENSPVVLLIVDVINAMDFEGGAELFRHALPMAERLRTFAERARSADVPVIYVNDNFGRWRSDFRTLLEHCIAGETRGSPIARLLAPGKSDYFVLKPKHSGFFSTTLDTLLEYLHAKTVIIAGLTTDLCVLFTASDAHMRDLNIVIPSDCCAAQSADDHEKALSLLRKSLNAEVLASDEIDLAEIAGRGL
jgi:nicotinamidase-related amidase